MSAYLLIDNYDSFTYNLAALIKKQGVTVDVIERDQVVKIDANRYTGMVISPGPGHPSEFPSLLETITALRGILPILGVCLGFQSLAISYGENLINLPEVYHGRKSQIRLVNHDPLYEGINENIWVGRYHSWGMKDIAHPRLIPSAKDVNSDIIMSFYNLHEGCFGVQYHPESYMTVHGDAMIQNFIKFCDQWPR